MSKSSCNVYFSYLYLLNGVYKSCLTVRLKSHTGTKVGHKILELRYVLDKLIKATLGITA